jgi:hypothetical protein
MTFDHQIFVLHPEHKDLKRGELPPGFQLMREPVKPLHRGWLALITLFGMCVVVTFGPLSLDTIGSLVRYLQYGREMTATVDSCTMMPLTRKSKYAEITYSYTIDGVLYHHKMDSGGDCTEFPQGYEFKGFYLPHEPTPMKFGVQSSLTLELAMHSSVLVGYVSILGVIPLLTLLHSIWHGVFKQRNIQNVAREGRITKIYREKEDFFVVEYRFKPSPKTSVKGSDAARRPDLIGIPLPGAGTPVIVLYTDRHTHRLL